jgi:hypothetical protein
VHAGAPSAPSTQLSALLLSLPKKGFTMLHQHTLTTLKTLKLPGMAAALEEQHIQPVTQSLSFDDRFGLIVDRCEFAGA